jgi:hypothetical protein
LDVLEIDIAEVDETMFHGVERPYETIFCNLEFEKSDFDETA